MRKIKNKKGFTLIELLAAVVILGILMLVAIPRVSKYIDDSRKGAFVDTALAYVQAARYKVLQGDILCDNGGSITFQSINLEKGTQSSYGKTIDRTNSYVKVTKDGNEYTFAVFMTESNGKHYIATSGTTTAAFVDEGSLSKANVASGNSTDTQVSSVPAACS